MPYKDLEAARRYDREHKRRWRKKHRARHNATARRWHHKNREQANAKSLTYYRANRDKMLIKMKAWQKMQRYGLTLEAYEARLKQAKKCKICRRRLSKKRALDHCHKTRKVRGVLCPTCNGGLGMFKDDPKLLKRAAKYLEAA